MIYAGGYPQDAFNWWMNDPTHHDVIFNTNLVAIGAGFAFVQDSAGDLAYYDRTPVGRTVVASAASSKVEAGRAYTCATPAATPLNR